MDSGCTVIDYRHLDVAAVKTVAECFGLCVAGEETKAMQDVVHRYSKDATRKQRFRDDTKRKQRQASLAVRRAAEEWANEHYRLLAQRSTLGNGRVVLAQ
jgi:hypothetical protein